MSDDNCKEIDKTTKYTGRFKTRLNLEHKTHKEGLKELLFIFSVMLQLTLSTRGRYETRHIPGDNRQLTAFAPLFWQLGLGG